MIKSSDDYLNLIKATNKNNLKSKKNDGKDEIKGRSFKDYLDKTKSLALKTNNEVEKKVEKEEKVDTKKLYDETSSASISSSGLLNLSKEKREKLKDFRNKKKNMKVINFYNAGKK